MGRSPEYIPSPREIRLACKKIQEEWSEKERMSRRVDIQDCTPYTIPTDIHIGSRGTHEYIARSEMDQR